MRGTRRIAVEDRRGGSSAADGWSLGVADTESAAAGDEDERRDEGDAEG